MNFKDLQFSIGRLTTDVHSKLARNNPLQKQDTKTLSMWIFNERNNLASMRTLAYQHSETNKMFKEWAKEELINDKGESSRDIEDIGDKLVKLMDKQVEIAQQFANKYQQYRHAIKSIREREERLSDIREKKRTLQSRVVNLTKTNPKSPKIKELKRELASLEHDTHDTELEMGDFKRFALREAFYLRFNAMTEYAEKTALVAGFGKYIVDLLDIRPTPATDDARRPYDKGQDAALILADAIQAVDAWQPQAGEERPTLADFLTAHNMSSSSLLSHVQEEEPTSSAAAAAATSDDAHDATTTEEDVASVVIKDQDDDAKQGENPKGKGKADDDTEPPRLPPRSPVPTPATPAGYSAEEVAAQTSDHKDPNEPMPVQHGDEDLDLYDGPPPPTYEDSQQQATLPAADPAPSSPRNSHTPISANDTKPVMEDVPAPSAPAEEEQVKQDTVATPTPTTLVDEAAVAAVATIATTDLSNDEETAPTTTADLSKNEETAPTTTSTRPPNVATATTVDPTLMAANKPTKVTGSTSTNLQKPEVAVAKPNQYEAKEQVSHEAHPSSSPTPSQPSLSPQSAIMTPHYQQSPASIQHSAAVTPVMTSNNHHAIATTFDGSMCVPAYHQGQYQQLYNQVQLQRQNSRSYADYHKRIQQQRVDAGGFRLPTLPSTATSPYISADEEKRRLAERYAQDEAQARKESILLMKQAKPLPQEPPKKQSVIKPEPSEDPGYRAKRH
ncbi:hypothetical protein DM01DRAFT_1333599 [Hesseltinella vesiculosa]|uniref:Eisosome component PIL1-domain-containing protein n=1 Tax=Hesseltinella vesiculosa TaxID=101127 RepID=A0A1X2GQI5_9FUNG|nr:hypothetical protein DM01DRAFT_1333599 [Hesseltinella vesiculosa]